MTNAQLVPAILAPLIVWRFYQRFRRNIGRQRFQPTRMIVSVVFISLILCLVAASVAHLGAPLWPLFAGFLAGAAIGFASYKTTKIEVTKEGKFYTPNPYLGIGISLLFIGRLIYRFAVLSSGPGLPSGSAPSIGQSPLTLFLLGLTLGYYVIFNAVLVLRFKNDPVPANTLEGS